MIGKFRDAIYNAMGVDEVGEKDINRSGKCVKYAYQRPSFLSLRSLDEIQVMLKQSTQEKSCHNEDQAAVYRSQVSGSLTYTYFGIFDGHAGPDCAVDASLELHQILHSKLLQIAHHLDLSFVAPERRISEDSLIIGALESAFWDMDHLIGQDKLMYTMSGGCTALVALFILGKLYVANAGDSRALLCRKSEPYPMSFDFTPLSERQRLQKLCFLKPHLLGSEYTRLDYFQRPMEKDLGQNMLYRDAHMTGWAYKKINHHDLKFPVVYGEGKRSRLLATIGVTRGFGDHDLRAQSYDKSNIFIKPFLTSQPEVRVIDIVNSCSNVDENDILILGTDGLWDVVSNEEVSKIVASGIKGTQASGKEDTKYKYITIAQELVMSARGKLSVCGWKKYDNTSATIDDISVFVIPLKGYKDEYEKYID
ncbi:PPM1H [Lepeophtheirus salmonis]|uniref:PPM1H n=1 Tax=Lepeophtheirus salmonis TaxID=72036 RepID=A0A7R8CGV9_LEPSM|nr:PPM1H [Lepeophtheirus salmonis]CAF2819177.1 PPM1H [Lepeophtheirus salmonis]